MTGIISFGAYIPRYRMSRKTIQKAMGWFNPATIPGEKAVANYDEDALTMAVAASLDCLTGFERGNIDGLYFASTTAPYRERQSATIIANALNLKEDLRTADFAHAVRSGTTALLAAGDAVKSQSAKEVLICAGDMRLGKMGSQQEQLFGDGAASVLLGENGVIAAIEGSCSVAQDFVDHRRTQKDLYDRGWEERWMRDEGYLKIIPQAVTALFNKYNLEPSAFAQVIYTCPYTREHAVMGRQMGFTAEQIQNNLVDEVGDTGSAYALMMLAAALEEAKPGDNILLLSYGNGCDAIYLKVTEHIEKFQGRKGIKGHLTEKNELDSYEKYAVFRNMVPLEIGIRGEEISFTQISAHYRERKTLFGLVGAKCIKCGTPQYPAQRVCVNPDCGAIDSMEDYTFSDKTAYLFTYTADSLAASPDPPAMYGMVNFEGGGRWKFDLTDCDLQSLQVGMPLRMSFRRKYVDEARSNYNYFWKAVPVKEGK
ncbi:MAG: hydroxymethylglutaryl-CoA synthase family protein [Bacillota bacterium]